MPPPAQGLRKRIMENVATLGPWGELYVMLGTSSAALIGLLFVASSLHLNELLDKQVLRTRSRNLTLHLVAMLVQATAILTPQPLRFLGIEIIVVNLCGMYLPLTFVYKPRSGIGLASVVGHQNSRRGEMTETEAGHIHREPA
jgi:hypothetical protein